MMDEDKAGHNQIYQSDDGQYYNYHIDPHSMHQNSFSIDRMSVPLGMEDEPALKIMQALQKAADDTTFGTGKLLTDKYLSK